MTEHPEHLLAEHVDGALSPEDRALVEAHLASCAACAEEVALAREALAAAAGLPQVDAPFGIAQRALREVERKRPFARPVVWRVAGAAAAAAAVAAVFVFLGGDGAMRQAAEDEPPAAGAPTPALESGGAAGEPVSKDAAPDATRGRAFSLAYPIYSKSGRNYNFASLNQRTIALTVEAHRALEEGFPPTASAFYAGFALESLAEPAQTALTCVNRGVPPDRTVVPFVIEDARFDGAPAHLVTYLRGEDANASYDRVQVLVANRETCAVVHFARQRL